jgi:hypothetical protein
MSEELDAGWTRLDSDWVKSLVTAAYENGYEHGRKDGELAQHYRDIKAAYRAVKAIDDAQRPH